MTKLLGIIPLTDQNHRIHNIWQQVPKIHHIYQDLRNLEGTRYSVCSVQSDFYLIDLKKL